MTGLVARQTGSNRSAGYALNVENLGKMFILPPYSGNITIRRSIFDGRHEAARFLVVNGILKE